MYEKYSELAKDLTLNDFCELLFTQYKDQDNLTWQQFADIVNHIYGVNYTKSCYKSKRDRFLSKAKKEKESDFPDEMQLLKYKLADERSQANAALRRISREETIKEIAHDVALHMNTVKQLHYKKCELEFPRNKIGILLLSDWHYGLCIENSVNIYNTDITIDRMELLLDEVIQLCCKNDIHELIVANLGDMISGNIHLKLRLNTRIDVITQIIEVSELLAEFLNHLSEYVNVSYISVYDNHSRVDPKKQDSLELENLCRITNWYLRDRLENSVEFLSSSVNDIANIKIFKHEIVFVHGHKDNPQSLIKTMNSFCNKHIDLICSAHYHHFSTDESCNTFLVSNGSLMGTDDFAYDLRMHSPPSQTLIEVTENNVVDCIRKINLD